MFLEKEQSETNQTSGCFLEIQCWCQPISSGGERRSVLCLKNNVDFFCCYETSVCLSRVFCSVWAWSSDPDLWTFSTLLQTSSLHLHPRPQSAAPSAGHYHGNVCVRLQLLRSGRVGSGRSGRLVNLCRQLWRYASPHNHLQRWAGRSAAVGADQ